MPVASSRWRRIGGPVRQASLDQIPRVTHHVETDPRGCRRHASTSAQHDLDSQQLRHRGMAHCRQPLGVNNAVGPLTAWCSFPNWLRLHLSWPACPAASSVCSIRGNVARPDDHRCHPFVSGWYMQHVLPHSLGPKWYPRQKACTSGPCLHLTLSGR
jgi:hypothetical protein